MGYCEKILFLCLTVFVVKVFTSSVDIPENSGIVYEVGDPQRCLQRSLNKDLKRYEVLPGVGWDNLRNKDAGQVVTYNYSLCETSDDGQFLLPDNIFTVSLKSSKLETFAELFQHWTNFTSTTSTTINADAGLHLGHFGIDGSYSHESESVRAKQVLDQSVTTRVQLRYVLYSAKLQPDSTLNPKFKARLLTIASLLETNQTEMARYESQLLVRDFGTHVVTSVDGGASLVQLDQIKAAFSRSYSEDKSKVLASASASFFGVFHIGGSYEHTTSKELIDQYLGNRTNSATKTYGGPIFQPQNFSINDWTDGLMDNLVAVDRSGDPLHFVITHAALPELPPSIVYELMKTVKDAIGLYYKYNIYKGCTKADSENFSFQANVDDGSCHAPYTNYTFGGVYQTCSMSGTVRNNNCVNLQQKNPQTGDYSCPANYEPILLDKGSKRSPVTVRRCHSCGFLGFRTCCNDYTEWQRATYAGYWCVATGHVGDQSGFLFGGVHTSTIGNPLTNARTCPPYFYALKVSTDLSVCVSDDYELGYRYSVPFAGFFSCSAGNPLKLSSDEEIRHKRSSNGGLMLESFIKVSGASHWPRGCPSGYSAHLATVANACEISYCVQAHALSAKKIPDIRRPPFMEIPKAGFVDNSSFMISNGGLSWERIQDPKPTVSYDDPGVAGGTGLSHGAVAAVSVIATIAFIAIVAVVILKLRNKPKNPTKYQRMESDHLIPNQNVVYGSSTDQTEVVMDT